MLADTGAARTTLLDSQTLELAIPESELQLSPSAAIGVGGSVFTFIIPAVELVFTHDKGEVSITRDLWVVRHDLASLSAVEASRILRLPALLGRDVVGHFQFICDYPARTLQLVGA